MSVPGWYLQVAEAEQVTFQMGIHTGPVIAGATDRKNGIPPGPGSQNDAIFKNPHFGYLC